MEPRSHVALMREPRVLVAGKYFEWIACMVFWFGFGFDCPPEATVSDSVSRGVKIGSGLLGLTG